MGWDANPVTDGAKVFKYACGCVFGVILAVIVMAVITTFILEHPLLFFHP